MITKSTREVFTLIVAFSLVLCFSPKNLRAQQPASNDEAEISEARADLQTLLSAPPPSGSSSESVFKVRVVGARQKLRDLLLQKKGLLRGSIRVIQSSARPDTTYLASLQQDLENVNNELGGLDSALSQSGVVMAVPAAPAPSPSPTPTNAEVAFDATVKKLSETDLTKSAAPASVVANAD